VTNRSATATPRSTRGSRRADPATLGAARRTAATSKPSWRRSWRARSSNRGKNRPIPLIEALFLKLADCGLKGDWKAIESLLDRAERHALHRNEPQRELPEEDAQMLNEFLERRRRSSEPETDD
jgi:hypothetical protein